MEINPQAAKTIILMAVATYLTRSMGFWIMNRIHITYKIRKALQVLPGTLLVSLVAPTVLASGIAEGLAGVLTGAVAYRSKSLVLSMITGVISVWFFRHSIEQLGL